ncbi:hypothetical protein LIER_26524 [Lithospermum erythrorhizon]|uniref:Uncharacterized protein n=1 Tax=Lithospermum erythrorhizon TaxID=34254 RepID=A0AAV3REJ5_LITER
MKFKVCDFLVLFLTHGRLLGHRCLPNDIILMDLAKSSVFNEELRHKSQGSSSHSEVFLTESRGRNQSEGSSNRGASRGKSQGGSNRLSYIECHHCGDKGHIKRYFRKLKRENKKKNYNNDKKEGNNNEDIVIIHDFFDVCDGCVDNVNLSCDEMDWVVDSGASTHATSRLQRKLIHSLNVVFMEDYSIDDIDKVEKENPTFEDEEMVNTNSTTISHSPIIFIDALIEN